MIYLSYSNLIRDTLALAAAHPEWHGLLGVVGIPRSGMVPAMLLSSRLNLPVADLESYLANGGRFWPHRHLGRSGCFRPQNEHPICAVLVVDDSTWEGTTLRWAEAEIAEHVGLSGIEHHYVAVYGSNLSPFECAVAVNEDRLFEWNLLRSPTMQEVMCDMDGFLCEDPNPKMNVEQYEQWLPAARPRYLPTQKLRAVVSARLEKYRQPTVEWLRSWGVEYNELVLLNTTAEDREQRNLYAEHKVWVYHHSRSPLFIESDHAQAQEIHSRTRKPVLCLTESQKLYGEECQG